MIELIRLNFDMLVSLIVLVFVEYLMIIVMGLKIFLLKVCMLGLMFDRIVVGNSVLVVLLLICSVVFLVMVFLMMVLICFVLFLMINGFKVYCLVVGLFMGR